MTIYSRPVYDLTQYCSVNKERLFLYRYGDQCVDVTGGWEITHARNMTCTLESDHISFVASSNFNNGATLYTVNKLDLTQYDSIHVAFEDHITTYQISTIQFKVTDDRSDNDASNKAYASVGLTGSDSSVKNKLFKDFDTYRDYVDSRWNVDMKLNETHESYLGVLYVSNYYVSGYAKVYAIWLEKVVPNRLYLYNRGDQCTSVTGGWLRPTYESSYWTIPITFGSNYMYYNGNRFIDCHFVE